MKKSVSFFCAIFLICAVHAQSVFTSLPPADSNKTYVFYLHGGIVQEQGAEAVSKDFGPYLYHAITDSLAAGGFMVISEVRPKGTDEKDYALKIKRQVDSLLVQGVKITNIAIVGASQGAWIALEASLLLKQPRLKFALLGICNEYNLAYFSKIRQGLCGNFFSIYETSDSKLSCLSLFMDVRCRTGFKELALDIGKGHGFLYQPYDDWVKPLVKWISEP